MGTEAVWVPLVLSAVGTAASVANTQSVARGQDRQAAAGIRRQAENQRQINERVNRTLQDVKQQDPEATKNAVTDGYLAQVRNKLAQARSGLGDDTALSSAYTGAAADAGKQVGDYAAETAGLFGRMDAPGVQRQQEGFRYGNLGMDLDAARSGIQGDAFLNQLRMQGIRRNPYIDAAAGIAGGLSSGMMAGSGGTGGYGAGYSANNTGTIAPVAYQNRNPWALPVYAPPGGG